MQKQTAKMKSTQKLGKKNLDWKSQPWRKVNGLVSDDVSWQVSDVSRWRGSDDVT